MEERILQNYFFWHRDKLSYKLKKRNVNLWNRRKLLSSSSLNVEFQSFVILILPKVNFALYIPQYSHKKTVFPHPASTTRTENPSQADETERSPRSNIEVHRTSCYIRSSVPSLSPSPHPTQRCYETHVAGNVIPSTQVNWGKRVTRGMMKPHLRRRLAAATSPAQRLSQQSPVVGNAFESSTRPVPT